MSAIASDPIGLLSAPQQADPTGLLDAPQQKSVFSPETIRRVTLQRANDPTGLLDAPQQSQQPPTSSRTDFFGNLIKSGIGGVNTLGAGIGEVGRIVNPEWGGQQVAASSESQQAVNRIVPGNPNTISGKAGQIAGALIPGAAAVGMGGIPAAGYFAAQGVGQNALQAQNNPNVTTGQRVAGDVAQGGLGAALAFVPPVLRNAPWVAKLIESAVKMGAYQAASNLIAKGTVNPTQNIAQGVPTAMAFGGIGHAIGSFMERPTNWQDHPQIQEIQQQARPVTPTYPFAAADPFNMIGKLRPTAAPYSGEEPQPEPLQPKGYDRIEANPVIRGVDQLGEAPQHPKPMPQQLPLPPNMDAMRTQQLIRFGQQNAYDTTDWQGKTKAEITGEIAKQYTQRNQEFQDYQTALKIVDTIPQQFRQNIGNFAQMPQDVTPGTATPKQKAIGAAVGPLNWAAWVLGYEPKDRSSYEQSVPAGGADTNVAPDVQQGQEAGGPGNRPVGQGSQTGVAVNATLPGGSPEQPGPIGPVGGPGGEQRQGGAAQPSGGGAEPGRGVPRGASAVPVPAQPSEGTGGPGGVPRVAEQRPGEQAQQTPATGTAPVVKQPPHPAALIGPKHAEMMADDYMDRPPPDLEYMQAMVKEQADHAQHLQEIDEAQAEMARGKTISKAAMERMLLQHYEPVLKLREALYLAENGGDHRMNSLAQQYRTRQWEGTTGGGRDEPEPWLNRAAEDESSNTPQNAPAPPVESPGQAAAQIQPPTRQAQESAAPSASPQLPGTTALPRRAGQAPIVLDVAKGLAEPIEKDITPAIRGSARGLGRLISGIKDLFGAQSSPEAQDTKSLFRAGGGLRARRLDQFNDQMSNLERQIDKLPKATQNGITDDAERGLPLRAKELQPVADFLRQQFDQRLDEMTKLDPDFHGVADYMAHVYEDPAKALPILQQIFARRPMAPTGITKARVYQYLSEARDAGLNPVSNPITAARLRLSQMDRWITAKQIASELRGNGIVTPIKGGRVDPGMARLPDPLFGGEQAPEEVASVFHNALDPGLTSHPKFGPVVRGVKYLANALNQFTLGLSGFHGTGSALNSAVSESGLGIEKGLSGEGAEAGKSVASAAIAPVRDLVIGRQLQDAWLHPDQATPEMAKIADAAQIQGARVFTDQMWRTNALDSMRKAWNTRDTNIGGAIRAGVRLPFAAIEQTAKPVMEIMVPRLKNAAFVRMAQMELARNPNLDAKGLSDAMGPAWRAVDNRFGQIVYDNYFFNRTVKDMAQLMFRSVGWNEGTAEALVGGAIDTAKAVKSLATGQKPDITHRMGYAIALPVVTGLLASIYQYAHTGKLWTGAKGLVAPETGNKTTTGDDERAQFPTYMKDVVGFWHSPLGTLAAKLSPALGDAMSLIQDKDYYGRPTRDTLGQVGRTVGQSVVPYTIQDFEKQGGIAGLLQHPERSMESFAGIMRAPQYVNRTPAEQEAFKYAGPSDEDPDVAELHSSLLKGGPNAINQAVKDGTITATTARTLTREYAGDQGLTQRVKNLPVREALKVYGLGSVEEKSQLKAIVRLKITQAKSLTPTQKKQYFEQLNQ